MRAGRSAAFSARSVACSRHSGGGPVRPSRATPCLLGEGPDQGCQALRGIHLLRNHGGQGRELSKPRHTPFPFLGRLSQGVEHVAEQGMRLEARHDARRRCTEGVPRLDNLTQQPGPCGSTNLQTNTV